MANHENLVIEDDQQYSKKVGRVLFFDFDDNPGVKLALGDVITKGEECLVISNMGGVRAIKNGKIREAFIAIQVKKHEK